MNNIDRTNRTTPDNIIDLLPGQIFGFGSNEAGIHGAGAARLALDKFGAEMYKGWGLQGQSFAIPTKDKRIQTLPIEQVAYWIDRYIQNTTLYPELTFLTTEIGCGLAGFVPEEIAPYFSPAKDLENIWLPKRFWDIIDK